MRKITVAIIALIVVGLMLPTVFSSDANSIVITYGETTNANSNYKAIVNDFFTNTANVNVNDADVKIITASDVNAISGSITQKTYNSDQIFSSALVDLNGDGNINVKVDSSKITTITPKMYASALKSAGISQGNVYVTSPVTATGESALAGIMNSYEAATNTEIPEEVKQAATDEITVQSEILDNDDSNVTAEDLSNLVEDVKDTVQEGNITNHNEIVNIIYNYTVNNNINITNSDIENLADTIEQVQSVQAQADQYQDKIDDIVGNASGSGFSLDGLFNQILSIFS